VILVVLSFVDFKLLGVPDFVGFDNYRKLFTSPNFGPSVLNTLFSTFVVVPGGMVIALLVALGLNQRLRLRPLFRTAFYLPVVTSTVAVATVWEWVYNPQSGLANQILSFFGLARSGWLTDPNIALPALAVVGLWQGLGTKMVLYLGGLQGVSPDLLEAARLDGASPWQVFWNVTWPALRPVHFFVVVTSIATSFQAFDLIYVTTQGGPINATRVLAYDVFQNAFGNFEFGEAAAETMVMLVVLAAIIYLARRTQRERD
jgi:multiple sugar transport system permease protein